MKFATNDPNVVFSFIPFQDDDMERLVEMCLLETFLSQNVNANDKVIIIDVSMWVLYEHMLTDQRHSVCSHVTERRHVKRSYDGTVANESDALLCEMPRRWLDPTQLETLSRIAEKHEQVNIDCNGASVPDR